MDELLEKLLADGRLDANYVEEIQDKVDAIDFNDVPPSGNVTSPRPTIATTKPARAARTAALKETLAGHLLPDASYDAVREQIGTSELRKKLESYVQSDVETEPAVKSEIDEKIAALPKGKPKKTVLGNADVGAAVKAAETASQKRKLDRLASQLDLLTADAKNKAVFTIKGIKKSREEIRKCWISEGFEVCDFLWRCDFRLNYILAEVDKSFVDEIDKRYPSP
jgi:hypothetical protein